MHRRCSRLRRILAFTLLELSVSIAVVGILLGGALVVITKKTDSSQLEKNVDHLDEIIEALNKYKTLNGKLPCPASRTELDSVATFGKQVNAGDCTYTTAPAGTTRVETAASSGVWVLNGAVPIYDLKLPDSHLQDPYGNRYTYSVIQSLTSASTFEEGVGSIIIKDSAGNDIITDGAYVLVSHGKEGEGAYRGGSGTLVSACGATSLDIENCDNDATFIIAEQNDAVAGASYYSDTVRWRSKQSLIDSAAASSTSCTLPWGGSIADGVDVTAYLTASGTCTSETRTCTEGTLSGTYTFEDCTISYGTPPTKYAFRLDGIAASDYSGSDVAIGDINGDGYGDAIVVAQNTTSQDYYISVVFSSATGINAHPTNLSALNGTNGFKLTGTNGTNMLEGFSVSSGDINGDGFDDVIIGNGLANSWRGYVYVVFGKASGWAASLDLSTLNGTTGFRLDGTTMSDYAGRTVTTGDINNDGYDDIIVGANSTDFGGSESGSAYIVFGKSAAWSATNALSSLDGTTGFRLDGTAAGQWVGYSVASGDINNDTYDDIIIGAPQADPVTWNEGSTFVVFGKAGAWTAATSLSTLNGTIGFRLNGVGNNAQSGFKVSSGDLNGDGYADVLIGAPGTSFNGGDTGSAYVVFGSAGTWTSAVSLSTLNGTTGFRLDGELYSLNHNRSDFAVDGGDFNGDGFDDLSVGVNYSSKSELSNQGSAYLVFGKANGWTATANLSSLMNGTTGVRLDGSAHGAQAGKSITMGDITGDNHADVIVGAFYASNNSLALSGSTYAVYGRPSTDPLPRVNNNLNTLCCVSPPTKKASRFDGAAANDHSGVSVAIGDINGDGFGDSIIGAHRDDSNGSNSGSVYVVFGSEDGINAHPANLNTLNGTNGFKLIGNATNQQAGVSVASSDVNNDGYDDVIVMSGGTGTGVSAILSVVFGKASGWAASINLSALNGTDGFRLWGFNTIFPGLTSDDVNGDGYADIIVSMPGNNWPIGQVYIFFGKAGSWSSSTLYTSLLNGTQGVTLDSSFANDYLRYVNTGDINGDGIDDVIVGANGGATSSGRVYVLFGKTSGWTSSILLSTLNGTDGFQLTGTNSYDRAQIVSSGDVNDDGFEDVIIGATGVNSRGSTYVVFGKASGWAASLELSTLNGTNGFRLDGDVSSNSVGQSVSSADLNRDGYSDIIIGGTGSWGHVYVVLGKASGWIATTDLGTLNGTNGFRLNGSGWGMTTGSSLATGDLTGDGYADILIGAAAENTFAASFNSLSNSGSTYAVYGHPTRWNKRSYDLNDLCCFGTPPTDNAFRLDGSAGDWVGMGQVGIGDVNADGYGDAIIGAYNRTPVSGGYSGAAYVVFGSATGINAHPENLSTLNGTNGFRLDGYNIDYAGAGTAVGDLNGDGIGDILVGSFTGTYVVFGKASGWSATLALSSLNGTNGTKLLGSEMYAAVGDINGDGIDDAIMSESSCTRNAYVVFGKSSAWAATITLSSLNGTDGFKLTGGGGCASPAYATSGDINGDGYDDIMYGDWGHNSLAGRLYVVFGKSGAWAASTAFATLANGTTGFELEGASANDVTGQGIAAGDINNDGYEDIITGAAGANTGLGYTYVVFGKSGTWSASTNLSTLNGTTGFRLDGTGSGDGASAFGAWVDSGDINGDGFDDVVVGAFSDGFGGTTSGSTYVVFGKSGAWSATNGVNTLVNGTLGFRLDGSTANDASGRTLAVGDMTGDNYDDILIGAYFASYNSLALSGSVWGVYGKPISWSASYDLNTLAGISGGGGGDCPAPSGTPITGVTYSVSSDYGYTGYTDETKMRDGNCDSSDTATATSNNGGEYIQADLGASYDITKIHLAPIPNSFGGWGAGYLNGKEIQYYNGGSWNTYATASGHSDGTTTTYDVSFNTQYIRIYVGTSDYIGLGEFWFEAAGASCSLPWGGTISDGQSVTAYLNTSAPSCTYETRICNNGTLSGSYTNQSCTATGFVGTEYALSTTGFCEGSGNPNTMIDGVYNTYGSCAGTNWGGEDWIRVYFGGDTKNLTAIHIAPASTSLGFGPSYVDGRAIECANANEGPWTNLATTSGHVDGQTTTYNVSASCRYVRLRGGNQLTVGDFWFQDGVGGGGGASCNLPWGGTISDGQNVTAYEFANSGAGSCSSSETRTCTNGTLSGSFTNQSCSGGGGGGNCSVGDGDGSLSTITGVGYSMSSNYGYSGDHEAAMTDGNYGASNTVIGTNSGAQWVMADLGSVQSVSRVNLGPINSTFGGWGANYLNGSTLECSEDGSSWCTLDTLNGHADDTTRGYTVDASCRYVRVSVAGNWIGIGEFWMQQ